MWANVENCQINDGELVFSKSKVGRLPIRGELTKIIKGL